jgi:hypothetical protein
MRNRWLTLLAVLVLLGAVTAGLLRWWRQGPAAPQAGNLRGPAGTTTTTPPARLRTFVAVADAKVDAADPDRDFGSSRTLRVDAQPVVRSYLRFEVRGLSGTARSATLRVWANSRQRPGFRVRRLTTASWSERSITFARQPSGAVEGTPLGTSGSVKAGSWTSVDVTPLLAGGGEGSRSVVLDTTGPTGLSLASREDAAHAPRLVVEVA